MIVFIVVCIFIGIVLAFFAAPIIMVANRQKLKEMDKLLAEYGALSPEEKQRSGPYYREHLTEMKNSIWSGDKAAIEAARDKLLLI